MGTVATLPDIVDEPGPKVRAIVLIGNALQAGRIETGLGAQVSVGFARAESGF